MMKKILPYLVIFIGIFYGFWPLDIIPDIPPIGWIDDLGIVGAALIYGLRLLAKRKKGRL